MTKRKREGKSLVQRLYDLFGDHVLKKNGEPPSEDRKVPSFLCRLFCSLKRGTDTVQPQRTAVITVGLRKCITDRHVEAVLTHNVAMVSKISVLGSLFANYLAINNLEKGIELPDFNQAIFESILSMCRGNRIRDSKLQKIFTEFLGETGLRIIDSHGISSQICKYKAIEMSTAAQNYTQILLPKRVEQILKFALHEHLIQSDNDMSMKVRNRRVHQIAIKIISGIAETELADLVLQNGFLSDQNIRSIHKKFHGCSKLKKTDLMRFHHQIQQDYLVVKRLQFETLAQISQNMERTEKQKLFDGIRKPPKLIAPLPKCESKATFIRLDKKGIIQLFPNLEDKCNGPWWFLSFMNPFTKAANIPLFRSHKNRAALSEHSLIEIFKGIQQGTTENCPWIIDNTVMTDGVQLKISVISCALDHSGPPGKEFRLSLAIFGSKLGD